MLRDWQSRRRIACLSDFEHLEAGLCGARDGRFKSNFGLKSRRLGANAPVSSQFRFFHYSCVFGIADRLRRAPLDHCHRGYVQRRHGGAGHLGRQR